MARSEFLIIEPCESGFLMIRFSRDGEFAGDTWHDSVESAEEQALFEYLRVTPWKRLPGTLSDLKEIAKYIHLHDDLFKDQTRVKFPWFLGHGGVNKTPLEGDVVGMGQETCHWPCVSCALQNMR